MRRGEKHLTTTNSSLMWSEDDHAMTGAGGTNGFAYGTKLTANRGFFTGLVGNFNGMLLNNTGTSQSELSEISGGANSWS
jgi:hypothetical protein